MRASQPFKFKTASCLIRIGNYKCSNLPDLKKGIAQKLGEQGREHVRENFLMVSNVRRYLALFLHLQNEP